MDTRVIDTSLWRNASFRALDDKAARILLFLLTNDRATVLPCYKIGLDEVAFYCGTTESKVEEILPSLQEFGVFYIEGYFLLSDKFTRTQYLGGRTEDKRQRLWDFLPSTLQELVDVEGSIDYSLLNEWSINGQCSPVKTKPITKSKSKTNTGGSVRGGEADKLIEIFNEVWGTSYRSHKSWFKNCEHWRQVYSLDDMTEAIRRAKSHSFWKDKLDLDKLLRTNEDRIGQLLNSKPQKGSMIGYNYDE